MKLQLGDHVRVRRAAQYWHHGIYCGSNDVIHFSGELGAKTNAEIRRDSLTVFLDGGEVEVVSYRACDPPAIAVERALSRLGERGYNLFFNNCEHFATWCKTGERRSKQVEDGGRLGGTGAVGAGVTRAVFTAAAASGAAGLSGGAGTMATLATVGGVVGGGAVAGLTVLGAAPATLSVLALRESFKDEEGLKPEERAARSAARHVATVGAAAGTLASVGAVSMAGSVAGLSGAGITSGLAAVGGVVGGGMTAGVAITVAAPALAAAGLSYGVYRLVRWVSD